MALDGFYNGYIKDHITVQGGWYDYSSFGVSRRSKTQTKFVKMGQNLQNTLFSNVFGLRSENVLGPLGRPNIYIKY